MTAIQKYYLSLESDRSGSCPTDKGNPFSLPILLNGIINTGKMKTINLTKGFVALVDDEDFELLNQRKWFAKVKKRGDKQYIYAICNVQLPSGMWTSKTMHRIILNPHLNELVDHIDHNGLNNQKSNLRICTNGQNQMNRFNASKTGFKGVNKNRNGRYFAAINVDKKRIRLGTYNTPEEAAHVRDEAAIKYHKDFANLNFAKRQFFDREFIEWIGFHSAILYYRDVDEKWIKTRFDMSENPSEEYDDYTLDELFEYWKQNISK